ncbi:uncharacterized protein [Physcomitrium patens]|uniref:uncharacterized protein isoform X2 n=1 Tax=Physcomitrium patens TaxID=3218 RepID=UPI003CCD2948
MFKGNIFGGVTLDKASMLTRSIAMLPSASTGESSLGVDEPIHGLALSIAGQDKANILYQLLSAKALLR